MFVFVHRFSKIPSRSVMLSFHTTSQQLSCAIFTLKLEKTTWLSGLTLECLLSALLTLFNEVRFLIFFNKVWFLGEFSVWAMFVHLLPRAVVLAHGILNYWLNCSVVFQVIMLGYLGVFSKCNKMELGTPLFYVSVSFTEAQNLFNLVYGKLKHWDSLVHWCLGTGDGLCPMHQHLCDVDVSATGKAMRYSVKSKGCKKKKSLQWLELFITVICKGKLIQLCKMNEFHKIGLQNPMQALLCLSFVIKKMVLLLRRKQRVLIATVILISVLAIII